MIPNDGFSRMKNHRIGAILIGLKNGIVLWFKSVQNAQIIAFLKVIKPSVTVQL